MEGVMVQPGKDEGAKEIYPGIQGTNSPTLQSNLAFLAQQQRIRAALQQQDPFALHRHTDSLMMSAVARQQLASSLGSNPFPFFHVGGLYAPSSTNRSTDFCPTNTSGTSSTTGSGTNPLALQLQKNKESQYVSGAFPSPHVQAQGPATLDSKRYTTNSSSDRFPSQDQLQIPCQARGMSPDHNSLTAYFEIPRDIIHGQHLYCSHTGCRASGVKFRYCLYCRKPVTKQNFRSRHLHADDQQLLNESAKKRTLDELLDEPTEDCAQTNDSHHLQQSAKAWRKTVDSPSMIAVPAKLNSTGVPKAIDHLSFPFAGREVLPQLKEKSILLSHHDPTHHSKLLGNTRLSPSAAPGKQCGVSPDMILEQWRSLLEMRPSSLEGMDLWLSKVLLHVRGLPGGWKEDINRGDLCTKWEKLLYNHPNHDDSGNKVTSWLTDVIQASCQDRH